MKSLWGTEIRILSIRLHPKIPKVKIGGFPNDIRPVNIKLKRVSLNKKIDLVLTKHSDWLKFTCVPTGVCVGGGGMGGALLTEQKISNKFIVIVNYEL